MTTSSHPWKQELIHRAAALQAFTGSHHLTGLSTVKLEEDIVLGCYAIRRLVSGFLIPESRAHQPFPMTAYPRRRQAAPALGGEPLTVRYDLEAGRVVQHDLMFLCHQVLQNCVFEPWTAEGNTLRGIYVTSDHQRKIALYGVSLTALVDLFLRIGKDE